MKYRYVQILLVYKTNDLLVNLNYQNVFIQYEMLFTYLCFLSATVNTINATATDRKITVATIVKINKAAGTFGCFVRPSAVGGSISMNTRIVNSTLNDEWVHTISPSVTAKTRVCNLNQL